VTLTEILCLAVGLLLLAMFVNALRKATGLLLVILGILTCMTGIGMIVGVPLIFVGGVLLFL
jgi:hypothetical protein